MAILRDLLAERQPGAGDPLEESVSICNFAADAHCRGGTDAVGSIFNAIRSDRFRERVEAIRQTWASTPGTIKEKKDAVAPTKKALPGALFAGKFSYRRADKCERLSGLLCLDFDHLDDEHNGHAVEWRDRLAEDPHVLGTFLSPTASGVKVVVRIDPARPFIDSFQAADAYFRSQFNLKADSSCKDPSRLCFLSYDPDIAVQENCERIPYTEKYMPTVNGRAAPVIHGPSNNGRSNITADDVKDILASIPARPGYDEWIRIIAGVKSVGLPLEVGVRLLMEWSPEEKAGEYAAKWMSNLEKGKIENVVAIAARHGYNQPTEAWLDIEDPKVILQCAMDGQLGDAKLFAAMVRRELLYDHTAKGWRSYGGGVWSIDRKRATRRRLFPLLKKKYGRELSRVNRELDEAVAEGLSGKDLKEDPRSKAVEAFRGAIFKLTGRRYQDDVLALAGDLLPCTRDEFDADPMLLNCLNGTLDLRSGRLHDHDPKDLLSFKTRARAALTAECPRFLAFLDLIFENDQAKIDFLQRAVGYSLTGNTNLDAIFFCHGPGGNGKTTFVKAVDFALGDYVTALPVEALLSQGRGRDAVAQYEVLRLLRARMALVSEIPDERRLNEAMVKDLTGGDMITARAPYELPVTFAPTHKLWLCGNHRPRITGGDDGIWRRFYVITFDRKLPKPGEPDWRDRDEVLAELREEADGILTWAIKGLASVKKIGLAPPDCVRAATQDYRNDEDLLHEFIFERCQEDTVGCVLFSEFYNAFAAYAEGAGERRPTKRAVSANLRRLGKDIRPGSGNQKFVWGLRVGP